MAEIWKPLKGYENYYFISNKGRLKTIERKVINKKGLFTTIKEKILKQRTSSSGRKFVRAKTNYGFRRCYVKEAMENAFLNLNIKPNRKRVSKYDNEDEEKVINEFYSSKDRTEKLIAEKLGYKIHFVTKTLTKHLNKKVNY